MANNEEDLSFLDSIEESVPAPQDTANQGGEEDLSFLDAAGEDIPVTETNPNPPTPLSAAVHGFGSGLTYNTADEISNLADPSAGSRFQASQQEYPGWYMVSQLVGSVLSPNPVGKLKAVGTAAKTLKNAMGFTSQTALAAAGASEKKGLARLDDVKESLQDPLTLGLAGLSVAGPAMLTGIKSRGAAGALVKDGDTALGLGKTIRESLASDEGQEVITKAVNSFQDDTRSALDKAREIIGLKLDEVAAQNVDNVVNSKPILEKAHGIVKKFTPKLSSDLDGKAANNIKDWLTRHSQLLKKSNGNLEAADFRALYEAKKDLGKIVFKDKARLFNSADDVKKEAVSLYDSLGKALSNADKTKTFKDISDSFAGMYKTYDALDDLGLALTSAGNKLKAGPARKIDDINTAYDSIPKAFKNLIPGVESAIKTHMPRLIKAYDVSAKIAGQSPSRGSIISELTSRFPVFSQGSRLQMMNRLGRESAGNARPVLSNIADPSRAASGLGQLRAGQPQESDIMSESISLEELE